MSAAIDIPFPTLGDVNPLLPLPTLPRHWTSLAKAFVYTARSQPNKRFAIDSTGMKLTYGETLAAASALASLLSSKLSSAPNVGLLVPTSVGGALINISMCLLGRPMINLNLLSNDIVNAQIKEAGIEYVIASRTFLEKKPDIKPNSKIIYLEDLKPQVRLIDKIRAGLMLKLPKFLLPLMACWFPGLSCQHGDTAALLFTSGSTGVPKAVELSHGNILYNIAQLRDHVGVNSSKRVMGSLPFFHSFGFTVTLWGVACLGLDAVYHFSPLDAVIVGDLVEKHQCSIMACTPSLMGVYMTHCKPKHFASLDFLILGSEKLWPEVKEKIETTLQVTVLDGYGVTETSPFLASGVKGNVKTPDGRSVSGNKSGSVGQPAPGTTVFIADPDTGKPLATGEEGVIFVHGPQVMKGYYNRPDATADVIQNGWYFTGDIGFVDADGFLTITDRLDRIKMSGEMVPLIGIKRAIRAAAPGSDFTVVGVRDSKKGQRPVVMYIEDKLTKTPADIVAALKASGMPKLWVPLASDFYSLPAWPISATGKTDLKAIKAKAAEMAPEVAVV